MTHFHSLEFTPLTLRAVKKEHLLSALYFLWEEGEPRGEKRKSYKTIRVLLKAHSTEVKRFDISNIAPVFPTLFIPFFFFFVLQMIKDRFPVTIDFLSETLTLNGNFQV